MSKTTPEHKMFGYKVKFTHREIYYKRAKERYGSWSAKYENTLNSVSKTEEHPDIVSTFDIKEGEQAYVVWCEWNSGDSFGSGECSGYEAVGIFKDSHAAVTLANWIDKKDRNSESVSLYEEKKQSVKTSDGQVFAFQYMPWTGYFERLVKVHVQAVHMNGDINLDDDSRVHVH